jgi:hypothetical protein
MPDVRATKNGNWSDPTVWNTGALPTTADDVFSNNFTVNVDTNFQVLTLRSTSGTGITAGGSFNFNTGDISGSITSNLPILPNANAGNITISANSGTVRLIFSPGSTITGGSTIFTYSGNCSLNLEGGAIYTNPTNSNGGILINKTSPGNITITGSLSFTSGFTSGGGNCRILNNTGGGNVYIRGSIQGPTQGSTNNITINNTSITDMIINGNILGGSISGLPTITFPGNNITINGNITGGSGGDVISISSAANINITGSITAGSSAAAISSTGAHTLIYSGSLAASAGSPAIISNQGTATNIFTGPFYNNGAVMAVQVGRIFLSSNSTEWQFTSNAVGVSQSLYTADQIPTYPSASDVRLGTSYSSGSLTGTLAMPQASSVQFGVPVDNTTGSAVLTTASLASAIWDRSRSELSTTGSIGERLQNVATPTTTGTQISSYLL